MNSKYFKNHQQCFLETSRYNSSHGLCWDTKPIMFCGFRFFSSAYFLRIHVGAVIESHICLHYNINSREM